MTTLAEEALVERLAPKIEERIRYKLVRSVITALAEEFYPPEEQLREDLVNRVEAAEQRVKAGTARSFKDRDELKAFLVRLKTEERRAIVTSGYDSL
jgi:N-methylhydantoinase A/oxoprolinase/acetone carboxylase beta subunit